MRPLNSMVFKEQSIFPWMNVRFNIAFGLEAQRSNDSEILLMDEPFAALDEQTKLILQAGLLRIWEDLRKTVLYVTHSIDEAIVLADRILVMTARPGRIKDICDVSTIFPTAAPRRTSEIESAVRRVVRAGLGPAPSGSAPGHRPAGGHPMRTERLISVLSPRLLLGLWDFALAST